MLIAFAFPYRCTSLSCHLWPRSLLRRKRTAPSENAHFRCTFPILLCCGLRMATTETRSKCSTGAFCRLLAVAPYLFLLPCWLMGTLYKPAVRDKLSDIWKTMDVINLVKNCKGEDEAESRHRINDAVWNRILHFHAVLNLKLKLCDYVMIRLEHGKICIHHF